MERAIATATFHPQAAAFTALLKMCAKERQWEKALEVGLTVQHDWVTTLEWTQSSEGLQRDSAMHIPPAAAARAHAQFRA